MKEEALAHCGGGGAPVAPKKNKQNDSASSAFTFHRPLKMQEQQHPGQVIYEQPAVPCVKE